MPECILIVGATRGLGAALTRQYRRADPNEIDLILGTTRNTEAPKTSELLDVNDWLAGIDLMDSQVGTTLASKLSEKDVRRGAPRSIKTLIITAGYFGKEEFGSEDNPPDWQEEQRMYTTSAIAPVLIINELVKSGCFKATGSSPPKIVLVSSESGSIGLRHPTEGGGNYGHHGSKAALNMVGKLLSMDLRGHGIVVSIVHPGFMRTDMTKGVGFDQFWDSGHAVTPDEAAKSLVDWIEGLTMEHSGQFWAPRGSRDIGTAPYVLGDKVEEGPLQLPW